MPKEMGAYLEAGWASSCGCLPIFEIHTREVGILEGVVQRSQVPSEEVLLLIATKLP